jgi:hypothetical protein
MIRVKPATARRRDTVFICGLHAGSLPAMRDYTGRAGESCARTVLNPGIQFS